jgi:hypothetical protein
MQTQVPLTAESQGKPSQAGRDAGGLSAHPTKGTGVIEARRSETLGARQTMTTAATSAVSKPSNVGVVVEVGAGVMVQRGKRTTRVQGQFNWIDFPSLCVLLCFCHRPLLSHSPPFPPSGFGRQAEQTQTDRRRQRRRDCSSAAVQLCRAVQCSPHTAHRTPHTHTPPDASWHSTSTSTQPASHCQSFIFCPDRAGRGDQIRSTEPLSSIQRACSMVFDHL